ncbi:hypothetical protein PFISCL1PPCAC_17796, partial [Pristionchus fissidentatus]
LPLILHQGIIFANQPVSPINCLRGYILVFLILLLQLFRFHSVLENFLIQSIYLLLLFPMIPSQNLVFLFQFVASSTTRKISFALFSSNFSVSLLLFVSLSIFPSIFSRILE